MACITTQHGPPCCGSATDLVLGYGCQEYWRSPDGRIRKIGSSSIAKMNSIASVVTSGFALCPDDSGGPLVKDGAIVGVASMGFWFDTYPHVQESWYSLIDSGWVMGIVSRPIPQEPSTTA